MNWTVQSFMNHYWDLLGGEIQSEIGDLMWKGNTAGIVTGKHFVTGKQFPCHEVPQSRYACGKLFPSHDIVTRKLFPSHEVS